MKPWNYKMYCLHRELSRKAVVYIVDERPNGWQILLSAILIESIVSDDLSKLLRRKRLEIISSSQPDKMNRFIRHLSTDLNTIDEILKELEAEMAQDGSTVEDRRERFQCAL